MFYEQWLRRRVVEDIATADPTVCAESEHAIDQIDQPPRYVLSASPDPFFIRRQTEGVVFDRALASTQVEKFELQVLGLELSYCAHELARVPAKAGCVRRSGEVVESNFHECCVRTANLGQSSCPRRDRCVVLLRVSLFSLSCAEDSLQTRF